MSNSILINAVIKNRHNKNVASPEAYELPAKELNALYGAFADALYDWRVAEFNGAESADIQAATDAAFAAAKPILAIFNAGMPKGRKVKFDGVESLRSFRDLAISVGSVSHEIMYGLREVRAVCEFRLGIVNKYSATVRSKEALAKIAEYDAEYTLQDVDGITADNAEAVLEIVAEVESDLRSSGMSGEVVVKRIGAVKTFRKACENQIADIIDGVMAKTMEEIREERKAHNKALKASRKSEKKEVA